MRELTSVELEAVNGGSIVGKVWEDIKKVVKELPELYDSAIESTTEMMCRATGKC